VLARRPRMEAVLRRPRHRLAIPRVAAPAARRDRIQWTPSMERDTETFRPDDEKDGVPRRGSGAPPKTGDALGHFVILDAIGRGGTGDVYAARDVELDRKVAIKVLRHGTFGSEERRARLRREAQALAKIVHPNVVTVHEVAEDKGHQYIAM